MKVLLSNDDGIEAIGLVSLAKALVKAGVDLRVSAPGTNQSAMAHKMTCKEKIRVERYNFPEEELRSVKSLRVFGTPVDSVLIGLSLFADFKPDIIVSGINLGNNSHICAIYSGTVAAAAEGAINGFPAIALSAGCTFDDEIDKNMNWESIASDLVECVFLALKSEIPKFHFLSVNYPCYPNSEALKAVVATQSFGNLSPKYHFESLQTKANEITCTIKHLCESTIENEPDCHVIDPRDVIIEKNGNISVTPMNVRYGIIQTKHEIEEETNWIIKLKSLCKEFNEKEEGKK